MFYVVCSDHLILCEERRLQCYDHKGLKQREWQLDSAIRYIKVIGGPPGRETILLGLRDGQVRRAISSIRSRAAPGPESIEPEHLKNHRHFSKGHWLDFSYASCQDARLKLPRVCQHCMTSEEEKLPECAEFGERLNPMDYIYAITRLIKVCKLFVDNPFPVHVLKLNGPIKCIDISVTRKYIAVVDDAGLCVVFNAKTKEVLFEEPNCNSVAFNSDNEEIICYSGNSKLQSELVDFQDTNNECLYVSIDTEPNCNSVAFNSDNEEIICYSGNSKLTIRARGFPGYQQRMFMDGKRLAVTQWVEDSSTLFLEPNCNSVAFNSDNEEIICYSGNSKLTIRARGFPGYQQRIGLDGGKKTVTQWVEDTSTLCFLFFLGLPCPLDIRGWLIGGNDCINYL
ncbi:hypothetical protein DICVIV_07834 [Dictyocaulus viviparus]|uniref:IFT122 second beta-propeller domain-containing protein n=1 Tax=Dictyocaulus viviparus TaxID=29172 RepID=A0A0D8XQQ6_DICVI|nr:hypothetical protein DICVIV_07834 [Dictyocaulus viviparus]